MGHNYGDHSHGNCKIWGDFYKKKYSLLQLWWGIFTVIGFFCFSKTSWFWGRGVVLCVCFATAQKPFAAPLAFNELQSPGMYQQIRKNGGLAYHEHDV